MTHQEAARPNRSARSVFAVNTVLLAALAYFLLPLVWLVIAATKTNADLFRTFGLAFADVNAIVDNVWLVFTYQDGVFLSWIRNTVFYATASALGAALTATAAGYAFAKFKFPGRDVLFFTIILSVAVPTTILNLPLFLLLSKVGLINTPWALILPSMVNPFGVYLMWISATENLPTEMIEAARIDGASEWRTFTSVVFPLLMPGFVTVFLFAFVGTWNNYFLPLLVFSKPDLYPLTVGLGNWNAQATIGIGAGNSANHSMVITGTLVAVIPLIIAFLFLQRYWQTGLTVGSVKG